MNNVLVIAAHPDDAEFGCAGTLVKHKECDDKTYVLYLTGTESVDGTTGETLRSIKDFIKEINSANRIMGVDEYAKLKYQDLHVPFSFESVSKVEWYIKKWNINTIYTHWAGDANQDHISAFKITMAAARYVPNVLCYEQIPVPRLTENQMDVNYYVDITEQFDVKIAASMAHKSQIDKYLNHGFDVRENLTTMAKYRGTQAGCEYAEAFKIIKMVR